MRHTLVTAALIAALAAATPVALAEKGGKGKDKDFVSGPPGKSQGHGQGRGGGNGGAGGPTYGASGVAAGAAAGAVVAGALIGGDERRIITDYFRMNPYPTSGLPPGIAKNLARGKPLPPGIAKKHLPGPLLGRLPPRPGHEWVMVGRDVLLVAAATGLIVDILKDAF